MLTRCSWKKTPVSALCIAMFSDISRTLWFLGNKTSCLFFWVCFLYVILPQTRTWHMMFISKLAPSSSSSSWSLSCTWALIDNRSRIPSQSSSLHPNNGSYHGMKALLLSSAYSYQPLWEDSCPIAVWQMFIFHHKISHVWIILMKKTTLLELTEALCYPLFLLG